MNKHISRRAVLKGVGATVALPLLEAMVPARKAFAAAAPDRKIRFVAIEMVHGSAGSTPFGLKKNLWAPEGVGHTFDLTQGVLSPLEPFREYVTIVSNTDVRNAEAFTAPEIGGDHFRSSAVFLTQSHPKQTQGSDLHAGVSIDQIFAQKYGQDTPIPSLQLCIENVDQAGGCSYGYSCAYTDSISWALANDPLPMVRDPRLIFDQLFGVGATPAERTERRAEDRSILDWLGTSINRLKKDLGAADRARLSDYLDDVREIERRIQRVEAVNSSGEQRELPGAPIGVPDSFSEHVKLMFDLQALAFASDITRRRGQPARQLADHVWLADGRFERPQPQARAVVLRRPRGRRAEGQPARQGRRGHADGERDPHRGAQARPRGGRQLRRQHGGARSQRRRAGGDRQSVEGSTTFV
jgi:hypothetical protein